MNKRFLKGYFLLYLFMMVFILMSYTANAQVWRQLDNTIFDSCGLAHVSIKVWSEDLKAARRVQAAIRRSIGRPSNLSEEEVQTLGLDDVLKIRKERLKKEQADILLISAALTKAYAYLEEENCPLSKEEQKYRSQKYRSLLHVKATTKSDS